MLLKVLLALLCLVVVVSGEERDRLTHIVVPYHFKQLPRLLENIESWSKYPPYLRTRNATDAYPTIVFYSSGGILSNEEKAAMESMINASLALVLNETLLNSIQHIHGMVVEEAVNSRILGSRVMFDLLLYSYSYQLIGKAPQIFFYMEPDCLPIKCGWIEALERESNTRKGRFWMQGSVFRGNQDIWRGVKRFDIPLFLHINGNAMYNIGTGSYFREYYLLLVEADAWRKDLLKTWALASGESIKGLNQRLKKIGLKQRTNPAFKAYDMAIARSFFLRPNFFQNRIFLDKFLFTDVIQNHSKSNYCIEDIQVDFPDTFLIHGGRQNPSVCRMNE